MKQIGKLLKVLGDILLFVVVLLLIFAVFSTVMARISGNRMPTFFGFTFGRVVTGSMEPEIPVDSLVVAKVVPADTLKIGDDILFMSADPSVPDGAPVSHRIVNVSVDQNGEPVFTTKGIANDRQDPYPVYEDQIIGRIVFVSDMIGSALLWFQKPWVFPALIGILFLDLVWNIVVVSKLAIDD